MEIKNKYNAKIILEGEAESIRHFLENHREADLRGADLRRANLQGADLRRMDLREADLRGSNLREADLRGSNLWGADLWGADLWGARIKISQKEELLKSLKIIIED